MSAASVSDGCRVSSKDRCAKVLWGVFQGVPAAYEGAASMIALLSTPLSMPSP